MLMRFSELPIPFGHLALGAVLIDTEGNRSFKVVTEAFSTLVMVSSSSLKRGFVKSFHRQWA